MKRKDKKEAPKKKKQAPAKTLELREQQLVNRAVLLAEKQIKEGTASSQVITHFLKLGTMEQKLQLEKLHEENLLLKAKTAQITSQAKTEELYQKALNAMRRYSGQQIEDEQD